MLLKVGHYRIFGPCSIVMPIVHSGLVRRQARRVQDLSSCRGFTTGLVVPPETVLGSIT